MLILVTGSGFALAGDWEITPSVGVQETFTDNAFLVNDDAENKNSDFITEVAPGLRVRGSGGRASLNLDFLHRQLFFKNTDQDDSFQNLNASGKLEVWDRVGFIETNGSISREVLDNRRATTNTTAGQVNNRTTVKSFNISPFMLHHFGTWAETETRLRYSDVNVSDDATTDTHSYEGRLVVNSGRRFQRLRWSLAADRWKQVRENGDPSIDAWTVDNDYTYVINRNFSLLGGIGYEDIEDETLNDQPEGVTWNGGIAFHPSRRTSIRATYGRRFDDDNFSLDGSHELSSRTRMTVNYTKTLQTTQRQIAQNTNFIGTDPLGNLIDLRTGLPFRAGDDAFNVQNNTFRQERFQATIAGTRKRNTFNLSSFWEERKTDATGEDETVYGVAANLGRQLSRRTDANVALTYRNTEFNNEDRSDDFYAVTGNVTYQLFRNARAVLSYSRTQRESDRDVDDVTENSVFLSLRREF